MTANPGPVAVVGASLAGLAAAGALLESPAVGSVTLLDAEQRPPYARPPLSKELLLGQWEPERCALAELADPRLSRRGGVRVTGLDPGRLTLTYADGTAQAFSGGIVIATGAVPRVLPGSRLPGVHVLRTMDDALALRGDIAARRGARVLVVGGGFIGTEVAAACLLRGHRVTILEAQASPFAGQRLLAEHGLAPVRDFESVPSLWSDQLGHQIQLVGSTLGFDEVVVAHGSVRDSAFVALYRRGDQLTAALAVDNPKPLARYRRLLSRPVSWQSAVAELDLPAGFAARAAG